MTNAQTAYSKLRWWQIALIAAGVSVLGGLSSLMSHKDEKKLYNKKLKQAPWSPPAAIFGPAWTVNNYFLINALLRIMKSDAPEKKKLLWLQVGIWAIFFSFNYIYFRKKSPVLAAIWTTADQVFAIASLLLAARSDKKMAIFYLPLTLWTTFASTLADYQALKNPDPVLETKAIVK